MRSNMLSKSNLRHQLNEVRKFGAEQYCTGPPEGWAAVGFVSPASFNRGLWARLLRVLGVLTSDFGVGTSQDLGS